MQRQTLVKTLALTFSHTQSTILSAFEHLIEYDDSVSVIGYETDATVGRSLLADIEQAVRDAQASGDISDGRRDMAFLRQIFPALYAKYGLSGTSHHLLMAVYFLLNGHRLAPVLGENGVVVLARPPRYSTFAAHKSFMAEAAQSLLANTTDRAFETVDTLCTLFPADPLFFALSATHFFPANWLYFHFKPRNEAMSDKVAGVPKFWDFKHAEFLLIFYIYLHKKFLYDYFNHYTEPFARILFGPDSPQSEDTGTPIAPTEDLRAWINGNPLGRVQNFDTFYAYFLYYVYFWQPSPTKKQSLVSLYGGRLRSCIEGQMARTNTLTHLVCTSLREAIKQSGEAISGRAIVRDILMPMRVHELDDHASWSHFLLPCRTAVTHADFVSTIIADSQKRAKRLSIVNSTIMSIESSDQDWRDTATTIDPAALRFVCLGGKIGRTIVYSTRPAYMLLDVAYDASTEWAFLGLTMDLYASKPIRTRRRSIVCSGVPSEGFSVRIVRGTMDRELVVENYVPPAEHVLRLEPKSPDTSVRDLLTAANVALVHATYYQQLGGRADRLFPSPALYWSSGIYRFDLSRISVLGFLYANSAAVLNETLGVIYRSPYYLYSERPLLNAFNTAPGQQQLATNSVASVVSWLIAFDANSINYASQKKVSTLSFDTVVSYSYFEYVLRARFVDALSGLRVEPDQSYVGLDIRDFVKVTTITPAAKSLPNLPVTGAYLGSNFNVIAPLVRAGKVWRDVHHHPSSGVLILLLEFEVYTYKPYKLEHLRIESEHPYFVVDQKYTQAGAINLIIYVYASQENFLSKTNRVTCGVWTVDNKLVIQAQLAAGNATSVDQVVSAA